jgi:hypothetical protein
MAGGRSGRMIVGIGGIGPLEVKGVGLERDERRAEPHHAGRAARPALAFTVGIPVYIWENRKEAHVA